MKIIFLDFDGPIATSKTYFYVSENHLQDLVDYLDPACVARVEHICKATGASVVISSS